MSTGSRVRHSFAGKVVRGSIHTLFRLMHSAGKPAKYRLPDGMHIELYPEGEIAEFLMVQEFFEKTELALVSAYLKPGMTMVDVGANIGLYSILAQKIVGQSGCVWSFEPSLESCRRLDRNLRLNGCQQVKTFQFALGDQSKQTLLLKTDPGFGDAYRYLATTADLNTAGAEAEPVPVVTLDDWAQINNIGPLSFLKIDIEGGEYRMLLGARGVLQSSPNLVVLFESDPEWCARAGCKQEDSFRICYDLGFGLYAWHQKSRRWLTSERSLLDAGMVWATKDQSRLPYLPDD